MKSCTTIIRTAFFVGLVALAGGFMTSEARAQKTTAKFDQNAPFSSYKTFMFSEKNGARNPFVNEMILAAIERELVARGLTKVDANPDLRIAYMAGTGADLRVAETSFGYNVNPAYEGLVPMGNASWVVTTGTLVIDLYDNKSDRVVFRGTAKQALERAPSGDPVADAKTVSKTVNNGIAKIFKKYPSAGKSK